MASKFDEEKRVLINDLTEEKSAHFQTLQQLADEKQKSAVIPKLEQELASLRSSFEEVQKLLIQAQKKNVEERNKGILAAQQVTQLQEELERMRETNDKTQSLLEESMETLDEHQTLLNSNPTLLDVQDLNTRLTELQDKMKKMEDDYQSLQEQNNQLATLLATTTQERDKLAEAAETVKERERAMQAQLDDATFNVEMSNEMIKDLQGQLAALGITPTERGLSGSTTSLLDKEKEQLLEDINTLKANLVTTETKLARANKQLNAFRVSASNDAKRHQEAISSLQQQLDNLSQNNSFTQSPPAEITEASSTTPPSSRLPPSTKIMLSPEQRSSSFDDLKESGSSIEHLDLGQPNGVQSEHHEEPREDGEHSDAVDTAEHLRELLDQAQADLRHAQAELDIATRANAELVGQLGHHEAALDMINGKVDSEAETAHHLEDLRKQLERLQEDLTNATRTNVELASLLEEGKVTANKEKQTLLDLEQENSVIKQEREDFEAIVEALRKNNEGLAEIIQSQAKRLEEEGEVDEEMVEELRSENVKLREDFKQEHERSGQLVQAIFTLQLELQQEKTKEEELRNTVSHLQNNNELLSMEVHDLREKGKEHERGEGEGKADKWEGLEKEAEAAVGLRAAAIKQILHDLEVGKENESKVSELRQKQLQLIGKLHEVEVELAESRELADALQDERDEMQRFHEQEHDFKQAAIIELEEKLGKLEQHISFLKTQHEARAEKENGHNAMVHAMESKLVQLDQHYTALEAHKDELAQTIVELEQDNQILRQANSESQKVIASIQDQNKNLLKQAEEVAHTEPERSDSRGSQDFRDTIENLEERNAALTHTIQVLESRDVVATDVNTELRLAVNNLEERNASLTDLRQSSALERSELQQTIANLEANNSDHDRTAPGQITRTTQLSSAVRELEHKNATLEEANREHKHNFTTLTAEVGALEDRNNTLTHANDEFRNQIITLEAKVGGLEQRNGYLGDANKELERRLNSLVDSADDIDHHAHQNKTLLAANEALEERLNLLEESNSSLEANNGELKVTLMQLESLVDDVERLELQNATLEQKNKVLTHANDKLEKTLTALEGMATDVEHITQEHTALTDLNAELKAKVSQLESQNETLESEKKGLEHKLANAYPLQEEAEELSCQIAELGKDNEKFQQRIGELEQLLEQSNRAKSPGQSSDQVKDLELRIGALTQANTDFKQRLATMEIDAEKVTSLEASNRELKRKAALADNMKAEIEDLELQNASLESARDAVLLEVKALEQHVREAQRTKDRSVELASSNDALEHRNTALASITDELTSKTSELEGKLNDSKDRIEHLEQQNAALTTDNRRLGLRVDELEEVATKSAREDRSSTLTMENDELRENAENMRVTIAGLRLRVSELEESNEGLVAAIEDERSVNHSSFSNLQAALTEEKEANLALTENIAALKSATAELEKRFQKVSTFESEGDAKQKERHLEEIARLKEELHWAQERQSREQEEWDSKGEWKEECTRWKNECMRVQRELTEGKEKWKEKRSKLQQSLWQEQEESGKLKEELSEEKSRLNSIDSKYKSLKLEHQALKDSKRGDQTPDSAGSKEDSKLRKDYEIMEEECRMLHEERNEWKNKFISHQEEIKDLKAEHKEDVRVIAKLRRDNELLWEQVDAKQNGTGRATPVRADSLKGSVHLIPQHTDLGELAEKEEGEEDLEGTNRTRITHATQDEEDAHEATGTHSEPPVTPIRERVQTTPHGSARSARGAGRLVHLSTPTEIPRPTLYPDESALDTTSIMLESQELAHQHAMATLLAQVEKLGGQLQHLVHTARGTNHEQYSHHQAHVAHLHKALAQERDVSAYLREAYEQDTQRVQEASLDALRSHLHGIKSVYDALSI